MTWPSFVAVAPLVVAAGLLSPQVGRTARRARAPRAALLDELGSYVSDSPRVAPYATGDVPSGEDMRPVLIYLPGIEMTGFSAYMQVEELSRTFDVRFFSVPSDDRTPLDGLVDVVVSEIEQLEVAGRERVYLAGESFGGMLALRVASSRPRPRALAGLVLVNPATSVRRSWPAALPPLLDAIGSLPDGVSDAAYGAVAAPILGTTISNPLRLLGRPADRSLPPPLRAAAAASRLDPRALTRLFSFGDVLPQRTLAFRLSMLLDGAGELDAKALRRVDVPVALFASTEDRFLPSTDECNQLARLLPDANVTKIQGAGHAPLIEAGEVNLAQLIGESGLLQKNATVRPPKDYVRGWTPPTAEQVANYTRQANLGNIRRATSPIFLSTSPSGERTRGLGALPPLPANKAAHAAAADAEDADADAGAAADATADAEANADATDAPRPVLFIGNHQLYGFTDLPLIVEEIYRERGVITRALAHPTIFDAPGAKQRTEPSDARGRRSRRGAAADRLPRLTYETFGAVPAVGRNLYRLLARGESALLLPGGVREALKSTKNGESYKLFWPDAEDAGSDFARVAARFNATVVPVAMVGAEEGFEMILDADEIERLPLLGDRVRDGAARTPVARPGERMITPLSVPKPPGRYYFLFGKPIDTSHVAPSDRGACAALYKDVKMSLEADIEYLLEKRADDPYEAPLPRAAVEATWNWTRQAPTFRI